MTEVLDRIGQSDDREITRIIEAVISRYREVFPEEEIVFLALPVGDAQSEK